MDINRMRKLAGMKSPNTQKPTVKRVNDFEILDSPKKQNNFNNNFIKPMLGNDILGEYIANNPKLNQSGGLTSSNVINESKFSDQFINRMRDVSKRSSNKPVDNRLNEKLIQMENNPANDVINEKIEKFKMLLEAPPVPPTAPTDAPPPKAPADMSTPPPTPSLPPSPKPPQAPKETTPPEPEPLQPEIKKGVSRNQLVNNVVQAVKKLASYVTWNENPDEKIVKMANKIKRDIVKDSPSKNNLGAIAVLLSAYDKIEDVEWKEVIDTNFRKHILANTEIEAFADAVSKKIKAEGVDGSSKDIPPEPPIDTEPSDMETPGEPDGMPKEPTM